MNWEDVSTVDGFDLTDHPLHQVGHQAIGRQPSYFHPYFGAKPSIVSVEDWEKAIELYNKLSEEE